MHCSNGLSPARTQKHWVGVFICGVYSEVRMTLEDLCRTVEMLPVQPWSGNVGAHS